jgi:signal transduction histidine kinase
LVFYYLWGRRPRPRDRVAIFRNDGMPVAQYPAESAAGIVETPAAELWRRYPAASFGRIQQPLGATGTEAMSVFLGLQPLPLVLVYTAEFRPISQEAIRIYWPVLAIAGLTLFVAIGYAWTSTRYANALARANAELAGAKARLQFESDERGIFIANMNHELRTPLNAIVGFAQILADATFGPAHPKYREYARDIAASGEHLRNLIGEIIDFSAIDQGRRRFEAIHLDAAQCVEDVVRHLRPVAVNRSISLVAKSDDAWALGDATALRQILINLVTNAIKFSLPGGAVEIRTTVTLRGDFVEIAVADRGTGIDADEIESIGRPFFRARAARLGAVSGTGLGLSVAVALAHQMGGRLLLESTPGAGTTVTLQLPAARP